MPGRRPESTLDNAVPTLFPSTPNEPLQTLDTRPRNYRKTLSAILHLHPETFGLHDLRPRTSVQNNLPTLINTRPPTLLNCPTSHGLMSAPLPGDRVSADTLLLDRVRERKPPLQILVPHPWPQSRLSLAASIQGPSSSSRLQASRPWRLGTF